MIAENAVNAKIFRIENRFKLLLISDSETQRAQRENFVFNSEMGHPARQKSACKSTAGDLYALHCALDSERFGI